MDSLDLRVIGIQFFIYPNKWKSNKKKMKHIFKFEARQ